MFKTIIFILLYVILTGLLKFILIWATSVESHAQIFFGFYPQPHTWLAFFSPAYFTICFALILLLGAGILFILFGAFSLFDSEDRIYKEPMFWIIPIVSIWLLNSYFIYSFIGVYSSIEYDGIRSTPQVAEFPSIAYHKSEKAALEKQIKKLASSEDAPEEIKTKRFLFIETAAVNGYYPQSKPMNGWLAYLRALFWCMTEYLFQSVLYIFIPLICIYSFYRANLKMHFIKE